MIRKKLKQFIQASIQNMSRQTILDMISPDTLERIKKTDKEPEIRAYGVGHEGKAHGTLVGFGKKIMEYVKEAIGKLFDRLKIGTPIFNRHVETNEYSGREQIGELIGKTLKTIGEKLHAIAAVYIYPQYRDLPLDVASIEANIEYIGKGKEAKIEDIDEITGIALSSSAIEQPGFPGATLLGAIQAFAGGDKMTIEEIKEAIQSGKVKPSDIFSEEELTKDSVVIEYAKKEKQTEYEHAKRVEKKLGEEREARIKEGADHQKETETLKSENLKAKVEGNLKTVSEERKLTENQIAYITKNFGDFKTEAKDQDGLMNDLNKFIDQQLKDLDDVAKMLGVGEKGEKGDKGKKGIPSGDGNELEKEEDYENPEKNPFIPGGKAAEGK